MRWRMNEIKNHVEQFLRMLVRLIWVQKWSDKVSVWATLVLVKFLRFSCTHALQISRRIKVWTVKTWRDSQIRSLYWCTELNAPVVAPHLFFEFLLKINKSILKSQLYFFTGITISFRRVWEYVLHWCQQSALSKYHINIPTGLTPVLSNDTKSWVKWYQP